MDNNLPNGLAYPDHDKIASTVRGWFHNAFDDMGYAAVQREWGTYWRNGQVYVSDLKVDEMTAFLADLQTYFSDQHDEILIHLGNPLAHQTLGQAFKAAGCTGPESEMFLAHVAGYEQKKNRSSNVIAYPVTPDDLSQFADTKLRAWNSSEAEPDAAELEAEIERREREMVGMGHGLLAYVDEVPAGFIWWFEDPDKIRWITQLATRSIFRKQGVATTMILTCLETAYRAGNFAVIISVDPANQNAYQLYQQLGFVDKVYHLHTYTFSRGIKAT